MTTRSISLTAVAALTGLVAAAPASAATKSEIHAFAVTNSLPGQDGDWAAGAFVKSKKDKCIKGRKITFEYKGKKFGAAKTDKRGEAFAKTSSNKIRAGKYTASMKKKGSCSADKTAGKVKKSGVFVPND